MLGSEIREPQTTRGVARQRHLSCCFALLTASRGLWLPACYEFSFVADSIGASGDPLLASHSGVWLLATLSFDDVFRFLLFVGARLDVTAQSLPVRLRFRLASEWLELIGSASIGIRGRLGHSLSVNHVVCPPAAL